MKTVNLSEKNPEVRIGKCRQSGPRRKVTALEEACPPICFKMKRLLFAFSLSFLVAACTPVCDSRWTETGVSLSLAQMRKAQLQDIAYKLYFEIPDNLQEAVEGRCEIRCRIARKNRRPLILDFKADPEQIHAVSINGEACAYTFAKEHIIIDPSRLRKGENEAEIVFRAGDRSLNRRGEFLYTLLVPDRARTLFPCFDQPNLKARFTLSLQIPSSWTAVSNTPQIQGEQIKRLQVRERQNRDREQQNRDRERQPGEEPARGHDAYVQWHFAPSAPLSTYLFSFVAGKFRKDSLSRDGRCIGIYHRETDPYKTAQTQSILQDIFRSIEWMETYTGIAYPFAKYDCIVIPGFQYGGMEHVGATLYNGSRIFLNENAGPAEIRARKSLIAHETAHMWFGDYVTMHWFNEVWIKEVFANYFAAKQIEDAFPDTDRYLEFVNYARGAMTEDRSPGSMAIEQDLPNLRDAGLIYGNIIYDKAPIVMDMLANRTGEETFRKGLRQYLKQFAYGNARWEDLIHIFEALGDRNLEAWSRVWVSHRGMPCITAKISGRQLTFSQEPFHKNEPESLLWPQRIRYLAFYTQDNRTHCDTLTIDMDAAQVVRTLPGPVRALLPNSDARAYGFFKMDSLSLTFAMNYLIRQPRLAQAFEAALLLNINENYLQQILPAAGYAAFLLQYLEAEDDPLLFARALEYYRRAVFLSDLPLDEAALWKWSAQKPDASCRKAAFAAIVALAREPVSLQKLLYYFNNPQHFTAYKLSEAELSSLAYQLAIHFPEKEKSILKKQENRISDPDRIARFRFVSRAVDSRQEYRDAFFNSLLQAENRRIEPWAAEALALLNHPLRIESALKYIEPCLQVLEEVQQTGDIFFPKNWIAACLSAHKSAGAQAVIEAFFAARPQYKPLLKNKVLQAVNSQDARF